MSKASGVGEVRVALPPAQAIELFTPEGERAWVPGWDPQYPAGEPARVSGSVFLTTANGRTTTWVVVESGADRMRYARVTPGVQAGTIEVSCRPDGAHTVAGVRYDLTALSDDAAPELRRFEAAFGDYMADWERRIAAALKSR